MLETENILNCNICLKNIKTGEKRYVCSDCKNVKFCLNCYYISNKPEYHTDDGPLPHTCTLETMTNEEYQNYLRHPKMFNRFLKTFETYKDRVCFITLSEDSSPPDNIFKLDRITYGQVYDKATRFGTSLVNLIPLGSHFGIFLKNIPQWYYCDLACLWYGMTVIPFHYQLNKENLNVILNNSDTSAIIVDRTSFSSLVHSLKTNTDHLLKLIIHLEDDYDEDLRNQLPASIVFKRYSEMISVENITQPIETDREILFLIFSSGSTGLPKGNILTDNQINCDEYEPLITYPSTYLSFLSLAHMQRYLDLFSMSAGCTVALYSNDLKYLFQYTSIVRPTRICAVPRIYEVLYSNYEKLLDSIIKENGELTLDECKSKANTIFKRVLGNRIENVVIGGAPPSQSLDNFLRTTYGDAYKDIYGCTEGIEISVDKKVISTVQYRLEPIPELGFSPDDKPYPRGELVFTSKELAKGYYKNPEATKAVFKDGWYYTGDIVEELDYRTIRVIDRKKNAFKLSNGEFVSIEVLENQYVGSSLIKNIFFYGDIFKKFLVAIVIPSSDALMKFDIQPDSEEIKTNNKLKRLILDEIERITKVHKNANYEIPKMITIDNTTWSIDNSLITPTGKKSRHSLNKYYKDSIDSMYSVVNSIHEGFADKTKDKKEIILKYLSNVLGLDLNQTQDFDTSTISFSQIGGDSIAAVKLSNLLKESANIEISPQFILNKNNNIDSLLDNSNDTIQIDWKKEGILNQSIQINGKDINRNGIERVFLTGATGYLGSYLLYDLLSNERCSKIYCLMRGSKSKEDAITRLVRTLRERNKMILLQKNLEKIIPVIGDLDQPLFGLDQHDFINLANSVDVIIHNGAYVHLLNPYVNMKQSNVNGTEEVIRLATIGENILPITHVSTFGIYHFFNQEIDESLIPNWDNIDVMSGYAQSKLIAEQLIHQAYDRGIPVVIVRPGVIYCHTESGVDNENDYIRLVITGIMHLGAYPDLKDGEANKLNLAPVDWVSNSIIRITMNIDQINCDANRSSNEIFASKVDHSNTGSTPVYLLTNQYSISFNEFCQSISTVHPMKTMEYSEWKSVLLKNESNPLYPMFIAFKEAIPTVSKFNITNPKTTKSILKFGGYECPTITDDIIQRNIKHIKQVEQLF